MVSSGDAQDIITFHEIERGPSFEIFQASQSARPLGTMRVDWNSKTGAIRQIVTGHGFGVYGARVLERWDAMLKQSGRIAVLCFDFWHMPTYDRSLRMDYQNWLLKNRPKLASVNVLLESKIVAMGVSVANLALGGLLTSFTDRGAFDNLAKKNGLPLIPRTTH